MRYHQDCFEIDDIEINLCYGKEAVENENKKSSHHSHQYIELLFTDKGYFDIETESGVLRVNEGEFCIIPTLVNHSTSFKSDGGTLMGIMFFMKFRKSKNVSRFHKTNSLFNFKTAKKFKQDEKCVNYFAGLILEMRNPSDEFKLRNRYLFSLIFLSITEMLENGDNVCINKTDSNFDERFLDIENYFYSNYMNDITLSDLAGRIHVCERQLNRILKARTGYSFKDILFQQRMWTARELLADAEIKITDIPKLSGFKSYSGFYASVKKFWGASPYELRNRIISE